MPRKPVSGSVRLGGQPLAAGSIQFLPADSQNGTPASGEISLGNFTIPPERGPVPGHYRVVISGAAATAAPRPDEPPGPRKPAPPDPVPTRYNVDSALVAEIKPDGPNTFEYLLEKK